MDGKAKEAIMLRAIPIALLSLTLASSPLATASARGLGGFGGGPSAMSRMPTHTVVHMPSSGTGYRDNAAGKIIHAPIPLKRRMTLNVSCYMARYQQLRAAGQDAGLASAGAALICG
jgi:hypothetical protein